MKSQNKLRLFSYFQNLRTLQNSEKLGSNYSWVLRNYGTFKINALFKFFIHSCRNHYSAIFVMQDSGN